MDRYWVGGTANWDATAGTKWATTSGGAGGASVPTSADDVYFDAASTGTCTIASGNTGAKSINCTGFAGGLSFSATITLSGSLTLVAGMTVTGTGSIQFNGTGTLTSAGKSLGAITVIGSGITVDLGDALISSGAITLTQGTFTTNNYNVTASALSSSNSNTRTINLGSSTVTLSSNNGFVFSTNTNLTFNAGTSTIIFTSTQVTVASGSVGGTGLAFYNVSFTSASANLTHTISAGNSFNDLTITGASSAGLRQVAFDADQTINGTLTLSAGANATCRTFVRSDIIGTTRTLTCAAVASLTDIDFRDITIAGAAAPVSGTRLGDCKGNSGITFDAPKTVYWRNATNANWGATTWSATDGGTADVTQFPLAQDTAIFPSGYPNSGVTVTINAAYNIGTIDMSARTSNTMTLACSQSPSIYGNWINGTGTTLSGTGTLTFAGRGSQAITSAGKAFTQAFTINTPGGSVTLQDAFTTNRSNSGALTLNSGTIDANGYNLTLSGSGSSFVSTTPSVRTIAVGSGTWTIAGSATGAVGWNTSTSTNLTVTGTGTISLTSASAKNFQGGNVQTYPTLNQGGTGTLTVTGSNKFANITNTAIGRVQFTGGTTNEFTAFNLNGVSGNLLQVGSTNTVQVTLKAPSWNVGANSTDAGNNTGLSFTVGSVDYLSISYVNGEVTAAPVILASIIEAITASSAESSTGTYNITLVEAATTTEVIDAQVVYIGTLNESATAADVAEAIKVYLAAVSESTAVTDLIAASGTLAATVSELATGVDTTAVTSRVTHPTIAEAAQMVDALSGGLLFLSSISEAATASEIAESVRIFNRAVTEATTASEVLAAIAVFKTAMLEQVSGADAVNARLTGGGAINEALTALDSAVGPKTTRSTVAEFTVVSDSTTNVYSANPAIVELAQSADTPQAAGSTFSAAAAEIAQFLDTPQGANTGSSSVAESAVGSGAAAAKFVPTANVAEAGVAQQTARSFAVLRGGVFDTAHAQEQSRVAPSTFRATTLAAAIAAEALSPAGSIYNTALPIEGVTVIDSMIGGYLWNLIDDSQSPEWASAQTSQNPGWSSVDDSQSPGWQNIDIT